MGGAIRGVAILPETVTRQSFYFSSAAILALAVCLHFALLSRGFWAISWDESARTLDAYQWAAHGIVQIKTWLPFYRICVGLGLRMHPDLFVTPRIITFLFGLAAVPAGAWLAHELFQSRIITLITLALNAFFAQRVALSLAPLSSVMFTAIILVTMAAFARWLRTGNRNALWLCALAAAVASTARYEGWVFNAVIFLLAAACHLSRPHMLNRRELLLFTAILFAYPAAWLATKFPTVDPVGLAISDSKQHSSAQVLRKNPMVEFVVTNALTLNLIGVIAVFQIARTGEWRQKVIIAASFIPLLCMSLILLFIWSAQTGPSWRMICVFSMLVIPFTARLVACERWGLPDAKSARAIGFCIFALLMIASLYGVIRIKRESTWAFPVSDRLAGRYFNSLMSTAPNAKVLIESSQYFFLPVLIASQHPDSFVTNSVPETQSAPILSQGSSVRKVAEAQGVGFFIFRTEEYKNFLDRCPEVAKVKDFGPWSVYKLAQ